MSVSNIKVTKNSIWIWTEGSDDYYLYKTDILQLDKAIKLWKKKNKKAVKK